MHVASHQGGTFSAKY